MLSQHKIMRFTAAVLAVIIIILVFYLLNWVLCKRAQK